MSIKQMLLAGAYVLKGSRWFVRLARSYYSQFAPRPSAKRPQQICEPLDRPVYSPRIPD